MCFSRGAVQGYKNTSTKRGSSVILIFFMDIVRNWIYIYAMRWAKKLTHTHTGTSHAHTNRHREPAGWQRCAFFHFAFAHSFVHRSFAFNSPIPFHFPCPLIHIFTPKIVQVRDETKNTLNHTNCPVSFRQFLFYSRIQDESMRN